MLRRQVLASFLTFAGTLGAAGCSSGITGPNPSQTALTADCQNPIRGSKYALCGHLSTASIAPPTGALNVIGSVDAKPGNSQSAAHAIVGGTFHATH